MLTVLLEYIDLHTHKVNVQLEYIDQTPILCWHYASIMQLPIMPKIMLA